MSKELCNPNRFLYALTDCTDLESVKNLCIDEINYIYSQCGVEFDEFGNFSGDKKTAEKCKNQFTKYVREIKKNFPIDNLPPYLIGRDVRKKPVHIAVEFLKMDNSIMNEYHVGQSELKANKKAALFSMDVPKLLEKTRYYLTESSNPSHWVLGLAIATGRRFNEIFLLSEFDMGDAPSFQLGIGLADRKWGEFCQCNPSIDCNGFQKLSDNDYQDCIKLPVFFSPEMILACHNRLKDYVSKLSIANEQTNYHKAKISAVARKELLKDIFQWESSENFSTHKLRSVYAALVSELFNHWLRENGELPVDISLARQYALRDKSNQAEHYIAWELSDTDKATLWSHFEQL